MLTRTSSPQAPWWCVHTDKKKEARLNVLRHILRQLAPKHIRDDVPAVDHAVLYKFEPAALADGRLEA